MVVVYAIVLLGLNILTGFNGQISLGHGAFFAIGAYTDGDPARQDRHPLLGDGADRRRGLPRRRIPVRPAGPAPRRALSRARDLRAGGRDAAAPEIPPTRAMDRRRAGHHLRQARSAAATCRSTATSGSISSASSSPCRSTSSAGTCCARAPAARSSRSATIRWPPPRWASTLPSTNRDLRRQRDVHRHRRRARRDRDAVRRARQFPDPAQPVFPGRHRRRRHRVDSGRVLRRHLHRVRAERRQRDLRRGAQGDLRARPHRLHVCDAARRRRAAAQARTSLCATARAPARAARRAPPSPSPSREEGKEGASRTSRCCRRRRSARPSSPRTG